MIGYQNSNALRCRDDHQQLMLDHVRREELLGRVV
jgi:hypothetical protein